MNASNHRRRALVLCYTTFVLLLITQLFLTSMAKSRLYQLAFPPALHDLHQLAWDHHLPIIEIAHYASTHAPVSDEFPTHHLPVDDEEFSGAYHAVGLRHVRVRTLHYQTKEPNQSPSQYKALLIQGRHQTWLIRDIDFQSRH